MQLDKKHLNKECSNKVLSWLYRDTSYTTLSEEDKEFILDDSSCEAFLINGVKVKAALNRINEKPSQRTIKNIMDYAKKAIDQEDSSN
ncbi:hypothetical protein AVL50_23775 [Flammeovirga sp. SJP92]|nr:hypothetical protein AVL50_23775 [Flammeovirga sp. SJP92]